VGKIARGFSNQLTGRSTLGEWQVLADPDAVSKPNVFAQTSSKGAGHHFNSAIAEDTDYSDLERLLNSRWSLEEGVRVEVQYDAVRITTTVASH